METGRHRVTQRVCLRAPPCPCDSVVLSMHSVLPVKQNSAGKNYRSKYPPEISSVTACAFISEAVGAAHQDVGGPVVRQLVGFVGLFQEAQLGLLQGHILRMAFIQVAVKQFREPVSGLVVDLPE